MDRPEDDASRYGRSFADVYDDWYASAFDTGATVATLVQLAGGGSLLELGAGTGRLAIPIAETGVEVVALDSSEEMLDRLRAHDTEGRVTTVLADMVSIGDDPSLRDRRFDVIACACSSILNLPDRGAVARCIAGARRLLAPEGVLVIEAIVPADAESIPDRSLTPARVRSDAAVFVETRFDASTGRLHGCHVEVGDGVVHSRPWAVVLCGLERFDESAAAAGLELVDRWSDWAGTPFDEDAGTHVSIWRRRP